MTQPTGEPLVTVITPCCNAAPFVAETIESVLAQSYPHIEHIVIDDGSVDASWEVIQKYVPRVTAVRLERNRGGSYARNRGAERARGEFLMFLDADDLIAPDTIGALVKAARQQTGAIAMCGASVGGSSRMAHGAKARGRGRYRLRAPTYSART